MSSQAQVKSNIGRGKFTDFAKLAGAMTLTGSLLCGIGAGGEYALHDRVTPVVKQVRSDANKYTEYAKNLVQAGADTVRRTARKETPTVTNIRAETAHILNAFATIVSPTVVHKPHHPSRPLAAPRDVGRSSKDTAHILQICFAKMTGLPLEVTPNMVTDASSLRVGLQKALEVAVAQTPSKHAAFVQTEDWLLKTLVGQKIIGANDALKIKGELTKVGHDWSDVGVAVRTLSDRLAFVIPQRTTAHEQASLVR